MGDGIRVEPFETEVHWRRGPLYDDTSGVRLVVVLQARTWAEGRWRRITTAQPATIMIACRIALPKKRMEQIDRAAAFVRRRYYVFMKRAVGFAFPVMSTLEAGRSNA
jgi:hypothetical protein